jgi:hypothetical protein
MKIYKELEAIGFFEWHSTQYGGIVIKEYTDFYDDLPLDNIIRTELNACAFKFFRDKYKLYFNIDRLPNKLGTNQAFMLRIDAPFIGGYYKSYEKAELECLLNLVQIIKK